MVDMFAYDIRERLKTHDIRDTASKQTALAVSQRDWRFGALYLSNDIIQWNLKQRKMADMSRGIVRRLI